MIPLTINMTVVEFIVLPVVAVILGVTIYFFIRSQRTLKSLESGQPDLLKKPKKEVFAGHKPKTLVELEQSFNRMKQETAIRQTEVIPQVKPLPAVQENPVHELKTTIAQQQKLLDSYLQKVEELENEGREELNHQINDMERQIVRLHNVIEKKDLEIEELQQEASAAEKMSARIEEVYREFDQLQAKMTALETQAGRANNLAIELEDTRQSYEQVHRELLRKHEKLEEVMNENQIMRREMNELEDKFSEANLQRQQLQKKVQFLTDLNNDMQSISDTNKKLQTELRRIGELESMLSIMAEERNMLLRNRQSNNPTGL
jgi:chromosome segregation ATPase